MANNLPINFPIPSESAIATYPYSDIQEGTGIVKYMLCSEEDDSAETFFLTSQTMASRNQIIQHTENNASGTSSTYEFDVTFNAPKLLKGDVFVNIPYGVTGTATGKVCHVDIALKKYSGSETSIVSEATHEVSIGSGTEYGIFCVKMNVSSVVNFKKGDILRLELTMDVFASSGSTTLTLAIDPLNRGTDANWLLRTSSLYVPFILID